MLYYKLEGGRDTLQQHPILCQALLSAYGFLHLLASKLVSCQISAQSHGFVCDISRVSNIDTGNCEVKVMVEVEYADGGDGIVHTQLLTIEDLNGINISNFLGFDFGLEQQTRGSAGQYPEYEYPKKHKLKDHLVQRIHLLQFGVFRQ